MENLELARPDIPHEKRSYRGVLIETLLRLVIANYMLESSDKIPEMARKINNRLQQDFKFETSDVIIRNVDSFIAGEVTYENENGKPSAIHFTITNNAKFSTSEKSINE